MADYNILLGVELDTSNIKTEIEKYNNQKIDLGVNVKTGEIRNQIKKYNGNTNNAKLDLKVRIDETDLKKQIRKLNDTKTGDNALKLNTESLEKSLNEVNSTIKEIKTALGSLDNIGDLGSIAGSINQISTALDKASGKVEEFGADLKTLANKNFNINIGLDMGQKKLNTIGYGRTARKQVIPELEAQIKYLENLHGGQQAAMKKFINNKDIGFDIFTDFNDFNSDSAIKKMEAMERYINALKKLSAVDNVDLSGFNDNFSKSASELINDITGVENAVDKAEDTMQKLKGIFGGSVDGDSLTRQLDSVVADLGEIKTAIQGLSSSTPIDGLVQSFNRLSETLDRVVANFATVKSTIGNELTNALSGNGAVKAAQQTGKNIGEAISNSAKQSINLDDVIDEQVLALMKEYSIAGKKGSNAFNDIKQSLNEFRSGAGDINQVTSALTRNIKVANEARNDYEELNEFIKLVNAHGKIHVPDSVKQEYGDDYNHMRKSIGKAFTSGPGQDLEDFLTEINSMFGGVIDLSQGVEHAFGDLYNKLSIFKGDKYLSERELFDRGYLNMDDIESNVTSAAHAISTAEQKIAQSSTEATNTVVRNADKQSQAMKQVESAAEETSDSINQTANEAKKLDSISIKINDGNIDDVRNALKSMKIDDTAIENMIGDLSELNVVAKNVSATFKGGLPVKIDVKGIETAVDGLERAVKVTRTLKSTADGGEYWASTKQYTQDFEIAAEAQKIRTKLKDTGLKGFKQEMSGVHTEADRLKKSLSELDVSFDELDSALRQLDSAMDAVNAADKANDIQKLVNANKEYNAALEQVYSQLELNQQIEKDSNKNIKLEQEKKKFALQLDKWLQDNSSAAKDFGARIHELRNQISACDDKKLGNLKREFQSIDKEADLAGKKTKTFTDRIKDQFHKYSAYFGIAEIFMYAEQGLRDMFEQVKLIDSAMTELKKVTDETDSSYNQFLTNAASRAKEIGTTIDGLVSSTADFARLGYDFADAQGLAEVANIYTVVGDEIDGVETATQSLISTMAAFKDEMNGMSDADFAMDIVDKFNEVSNNFSISSGGIGEALTRSASSLASANNTLDESIALITAANTVVQDPDVVGEWLADIKSGYIG